MFTGVDRNQQENPVSSWLVSRCAQWRR